jgi:hypothetical protein
MVLRQADVQAQLKNFDVPFFSQTRLFKAETNYHGETIVVKVHLRSEMDGNTYALTLCGKNQTLSMVRFSTIKNCYLLLPSVYEAILMQFEPNKVLISNQLPKRVFTKTKCPQPQTT